MPSPESSHRPPAPQEMRVNDPEALITAPDRASAEFAKSDAIEFGVNNFVELEAITKQYEAKDKSTETNKRSAVKKVLATLTAFLALVPAGLARSTSSETHTTWETQTSTVTTPHTAEVPIEHTSTIQSYEWDGTELNQTAVEQAADEIEQAINRAEQEARDTLPAGATVTSVETTADMYTEGGADDSHKVGPASNNEHLGENDDYNSGPDGLAETRAKTVEAPLGDELSGRGVEIDHSTTSGTEHVLTPDQITAGNGMAEQYGYNDFDELIQAVEHGWTKLNANDQESYDQMITEARKTTVDVDGKVVVHYETTDTVTKEVPVEKTTSRDDIVGVPGGFAAIATEERVGQSVRFVPPRRSPVYPGKDRASKLERRGGRIQRPGGGSPVRKINGSTFRGNGYTGAFMANSR